jgi:bifunctional enzyme Fae/Hps
MNENQGMKNFLGGMFRLDIPAQPSYRKVTLQAGRGIKHNQRYMQIAFDRDLSYAVEVLPQIPDSERILIEVGTPLIKKHGAQAIRAMRDLCGHYLVADVKAMDRGVTEVTIASSAGADAIVCLGSSPVETLNFFIETCESHNVDSLIDFMNVERPIQVLSKLRQQPDVIILHRGFDEYTNKNKQLPLAQISDIRDKYATPISVAGGVNLDDIQRAFFNGADIVVLTDTLTPPQQIPQIAGDFLKQTK